MSRTVVQAKVGKADWLRPLVEQQAEESGGSFETLWKRVQKQVRRGVVPLAVVSPRPVRGYALLVGAIKFEAGALVHVLDGQPDAQYRALFSRLGEEARLAGCKTVVVDVEDTAGYVQEKISELGEEFGIFLRDLKGSSLEEDPDEFVCEICGKGFKSAKALGTHRRVHL